MKYLIVGLGNIGPEYQNTRHNIGFKVLDAFAKASNAVFEERRYGAVAQVGLKGRTLILLKPNTFMNLSGKAVRFWMQKEDIEPSHLFIIEDDLALPFGTIRLRPRGSDGGHNGLRSINECLGTCEYARLRFGIGCEFRRGGQVDYVLGEWSMEEREALSPMLEHCQEMIKNFIFIGVDKTMALFNKNLNASKEKE